MFRTIPQSEVRIPAAFLSEGERVWHFMLRSSTTPWFHVTYEVTQKRHSIREVMFCERLPQLLEFVNAPDPQINLTDVQLISPDWVNGTGGWKMEPLAEVWLGKESDVDALVDIFVLENGSRYADSFSHNPEKQFRDMQCVFRWTRPSVRAPSGTSRPTALIRSLRPRRSGGVKTLHEGEKPG